MTDMVNHPSHYSNDDPRYEVIEVVKAWGWAEDGCKFNAVKYIARAGRKGGPEKTVEDLRKAVWYLEFLISMYEGTADPEDLVNPPEFATTGRASIEVQGNPPSVPSPGWAPADGLRQ